MKKDALEKLANNNRQDFDNRVPADRVWDRISSSLFGRKSVNLWNSVGLWRAAASVLLCLSVFLFLSKPYARVETVQTSQQEFTDIESFYTAQIVEKAALISGGDLFADDSYSQDIQKLEAMYMVMSEEMKKHPSEKVKDALVLNMLVRIDLMNQQIQKLEESKRRGAVEPSSI